MPAEGQRAFLLRGRSLFACLSHRVYFCLSNCIQTSQSGTLQALRLARAGRQCSLEGTRPLPQGHSASTTQAPSRCLSDHGLCSWPPRPSLWWVGRVPSKSGLKFSLKGARICEGADAEFRILNVPSGSLLNGSSLAFACSTVTAPHAALLAEERPGPLPTALTRVWPCEPTRGQGLLARG